MARAAVSTLLMARGSLPASHSPWLLASTILALVLKPITWNWLLSGNCAVIHSTMSSERRHFNEARRAASGWLRSFRTFTTSSSIMLAEVSNNTRMRLPLICSALMYLRVPRPRNDLTRSPAGALSSAPPCRRLTPSSSDLMSAMSWLMCCAARERFLVVHRRLLAARLELGRDANGASLGGRGILVSLLERVAQDDQVLRAFLDLFLELAHFAGEFPEASDFLRADLGLHDRIEQHHGAEAAADAVEERQRENFEGASFLHGAASSRAAAAVEISVNSTPGVPTRTRSPGRSVARSFTRAPLTQVPKRL